MEELPKVGGGSLRKGSGARGRDRECVVGVVCGVYLCVCHMCV